MPKRTNDFQKLVLLIERALAGAGATVQESQELVDRVIGEGREVDIVIRQKVAHVDVVVSVECCATGRPATVEWVEQQHCKHATLPTDKLVLVSQHGFTKTACRKANALGVVAISPEDAARVDWSAMILSIPSVTVESFLAPEATEVRVIFAGSSEDHESSTIDPSTFATCRLRGPDTVNDDSGQSCSEFVAAFLRAPAFIDAVQRAAPGDGSWTVAGEVKLKVGTTLRLQDGRALPVLAVAIKARFRRERQAATLTKGAIEGVAFLHARADTFGHPINVVLTQKLGESAQVGVDIQKRSAPTNLGPAGHRAGSPAPGRRL